MDDKRASIGSKVGLAGIALNIVLAVLKLLVGLASGMVSIVADSVNNFSDAISSIISLIGIQLSKRPADEEHPFGHARYEYISGIVIAFIVMMSGVELLKSSVEKIIHPTEVIYSAPMFIVLIASIAVKLFMAIGYRIVGKKYELSSILAASEDSRNDVISTSAVLIAAIIAMYSGKNLDGIMGILVSLFILWSGAMLVKDTLQPLLGSATDKETARLIEKKIMTYEGVLGVHDLMIHDYGPGHRFASVHCEVPAERSVLECHEIIDKIEDDFHKDMGLELVIHYDPIVTSDPRVSELRAFALEKAKEFDSRLTVHDLRLVPGENNTNVIFDCVLPNDKNVSEKEVIDYLKKAIKEKSSEYTAVVSIDRSFVAFED